MLISSFSQSETALCLQRERKACKKTFGRFLDPVHKPIHSRLAAQGVQLCAQKASASPAEAVQQQSPAEAVQQAATQQQTAAVHKQLEVLQQAVQQQGETIRLHSAKMSKLAMCKQKNRKQPAELGGAQQPLQPAASLTAVWFVCA